MDFESGSLAKIVFDAEIIHWRGPAPYLFAPVPDEHLGALRHAARLASYGWGCVPVAARIGHVPFASSLFPRDGTYLLPIKVAVQRALQIGLGDRVTIALSVTPRSSPAGVNSRAAGRRGR